MREKNIEQKFVHSVKAAGGIVPKLVSPGFDGKPRPLQLARHRLLRRLGFRVYVLDSEKQITRIIDEIGGDAE